jgi:hypothetical protein
VSKITAVATGNLTISPACSSAPTTAGKGVYHDDGAALQAAVNTATTSTEAKILLPSGVFNVNTACQTSNAATSMILVPTINTATFVDTPFAVVDIEGLTPALNLDNGAAQGGTVIQTASTGCDLIAGAGSSTGGNSGYTAVKLIVNGIAFRRTVNPLYSAINAVAIGQLSMPGFNSCDVGSVPVAVPTAGGVCVIAPGAGNPDLIDIGTLRADGFTTALTLVEHAAVQHLICGYDEVCVVINNPTGSGISPGMNIGQLNYEQTQYGIDVIGGSSNVLTALTVNMMASEHDAGTFAIVDDVYDVGNRLYGTAAWSYNGPAATYTANGAANFFVDNLVTHAFSIGGAATAGTSVTAPLFNDSSLTASLPICTDASKNLSSTCTNLIPIADVGSAGLSATLPLAITSAGAISTTSITGFRYGTASAADTAATAGQAATLIQGLTGCNTATYVFTPQASDCVAQTSGFANPMTTLGDIIYENATPAAARLAGPTAPNSVPQFLTNTPSAGAAAAEVWQLAGVPIDATNPVTLLTTDRFNFLNWTTGTALALPSLASSGFTNNDGFALRNTEGATMTITPNAGHSDLCDGASTCTILNNFASFVYSDAATNWDRIYFPTFAAFPACTGVMQFSTTTGFSCNTAPTLTGTNFTGVPFTGLTGNATLAQLPTLAADSIYQNETGSTAAPTDVAIPSCSAGTSALTYNTTTHAWGCNTISGSLSGMTAGQVAIAATASTVTSSEAIVGTDTGLASAATISTTVGTPVCATANGGVSTTGCLNSLAVSNTTPVTANNSVTTAQQLQELSLTAGYLNSASFPTLIHSSGIFSTTSTPSLTLTFKLCTVSGCGSGTVVTLAALASATTVTGANNQFNANLKCGTKTTGSTGNLICHGVAAIDLTSGSVVTTTYSDANTATSSNIDLTAALFLDTFATFSSASTSNTITDQLMFIGTPSGGGSGGGSGAPATITPLTKTANYSTVSGDFSNATTPETEIIYTISSSTAVTHTLLASAPALVSGNMPCEIVSNSLASAPYNLLLSTNSLTLDGTAYTGFPITPGTSVEICSNGSNYVHGRGPAIGANQLSFWLNSAGCGGGCDTQIFTSSGNTVEFGTVYIPATTFTHMTIYISTADGTNPSSWGLADTAGKVWCSTTAAVEASTGWTSATNSACSQGTVNWPGGNAILMLVSAGTTIKYAIGYQNGQTPMPYSQGFLTATVSGGQVSSTTITLPSTGTGNQTANPQAAMALLLQ